MGCCSSNLKLDMNRTLDTSIYGSSKRSRSGSRSSSSSSHSAATQCGTLSSSSNSSGVGSSACSTPQRSSTRSSNRSIWSRRSQTVRPICDDFAEQPPTSELDRSYGYHTCSSAASTPSKNMQLRRTQDMDLNDEETKSDADELEPAVGNLEWEMYMMHHAQRIMPKTSSPISQRRDATFDSNSRSYHKWRNYLQSTPVHMLHNVSHIPEAIAGHFCPTDFPAFTDLEEMESAAKRFKVDRSEEEQQQQHQQQQHQQQQQSHLGYPFQQLTHTISTDL